MRVAVVGAGAIGLGCAAVLQAAGHEPVMWSRPGRAETLQLTCTGAVQARFPLRWTGTMAEAVAGAAVVLLTVPGNGHRAVMEAMAPLLVSGQTVVISSHCSMSALYLSKVLAARGVRVPIIAWGTTVITGRRIGTAQVGVSNLRDQVDVAALPASGTAAGAALCRTLFGERFVERQDLLAIALSNVNPQNHLAMALCNLTRIEKAEEWGNYAGITPAVGRLMEALDRERLAIAAAFGRSVRTLQEHFHLSFGVPLLSVAEMAAIVDARGGAPNGPKTLDTRYVLEDIPFGIVATEMLAGIAGVAAPLHRAGIEMFGALYGRDFRAENDILPGLKVAGMSDTALSDLAVNGFSSSQGP